MLSRSAYEFRISTISFHSKYYEGPVVDPFLESHVTELESSVDSRENSAEVGQGPAFAARAPDVFSLPPAKPVLGMDGPGGDASPVGKQNTSSGSVYDID